MKTIGIDQIDLISSEDRTGNRRIRRNKGYNIDRKCFK
jgi:hypothetical protein